MTNPSGHPHWGAGNLSDDNEAAVNEATRPRRRLRKRLLELALAPHHLFKKFFFKSRARDSISHSVGLSVGRVTLMVPFGPMVSRGKERKRETK